MRPIKSLFPSNLGFILRLASVLIALTLGFSVTLHAQKSAPPLLDFTGDGKADIFWRNSNTGENYLWAVNGLTSSGVAQKAVSETTWQVAGVGDFNGDKRADVLWRNRTTGENYLWQNNGTGASFTGSSLPTVSLNWQVMGTGDFDGDGNTDVLWRNSATGENYLWLMNGSSVNGNSLVSVGDINWQIVAIADFNGDGKADILWYNATTGEVYVWLMNGASRLNAFTLNTVPDLNWQVSAVGDFNGDNHSEIIWRHRQTGQVYMWNLNAGATAVASGASVGTVSDLTWQIAGVGDVNGDGNADLFWRQSSTGATYLWEMNGAAIFGAGALNTVGDLSWQPVCGFNNGPSLSLPAPNPTSLGSAIANQNYIGFINASGGVFGYTWIVNGTTVGGTPVSLSDGLTASSSGGNTLTISGTPTSANTVSIQVAVRDSTGSMAGPFTYTVNVTGGVTNGYSVGGQIMSVNCCGQGVQGVTVTINTTPTPQTATTDSNGNFSFQNIASGTYTITPSITGPSSSVFYPASQLVTVSNSNLTGKNFDAALGFTVSGTVDYSGSKTGQIYLSLQSTNGSNGSTQGTSISATGAFTIRGVPPGSYTLQAWRDNLGYGAPNASNPAGSASVAVSTLNVTGTHVVLSDPQAITSFTQSPNMRVASPIEQGAIVQYGAIKNNNGVEQPMSYTLQWSASSTFASVAGSKTFPASGTKGGLWLLHGLTDGTTLYFRVQAAAGAAGGGGAADGPPSLTA